MERILGRPGRLLWAARLERPWAFTSPFGGEPFALMLVVLDPAVTQEEQNRLSDEIVAARCRYAVCAGHDCSSWDDSIDWAHLATDPDFDPPDSTNVMTTWHQDEAIDEVAEFFATCTSYEGFEPERFLVVSLGGCAEEDAEIRATVLEAFRQLEPGAEPRGALLPRLIGGACALAGLAAWIRVGWKAISDLDAITAEGAEGGRLVVWGLTGTVLMIVGVVLLHVASGGESEPEPR